MATRASIPSGVEKHLECPICGDRYRRPKVLNCLHSFCEECLVKYRNGRYKYHPKIPCPVCRQETTLPRTGITGLKTNFHLVGLIEEFTPQEKAAYSLGSRLLCQTCKENNEASHHCIDCGKNICLKCYEDHFRFPALSSHAVVTLDEICGGKVKVIKQLDGYKCHQHNDRVKRFYCKTCDELICQGCTVVEHAKPNHDITDSKTAAKILRESLTDKFPAFNKDVQDLEYRLWDAAKAKTALNSNKAKAQKEVQERAAAVIAKVRAEEKRILGEITTRVQEQNERLDEYEKTLSDLLRRRKHSLKSALDIVQNTSDYDFLSLHSVISNDLDELRGQQTPKITGLQSYPVFVQSNMLDVDLGNVVMRDTWELCLTFGQQGSGDGEFQSARSIAAAAAEPDEMAVADWKNKRVIICNNQGPTGKFLAINANDVVAMTNHWLCANISKVLMYRRDATLACEFYTVPETEVHGEIDVQLVSVAVMKNGNILVGDRKRKVLTEHKPDDGKLIQTTPVRIVPYWLAVMSNGWIVISDRDQGLVEIMDVSDGNAIPIATIQPTIDGQQVKHCSGVVSTSSGIFVAACTSYTKTGHIHHYNSVGQFVGCVAKGLYNPCGITLTADGQQLAVADWHSVKIYHKV
ncbi:E3 ubiquitin-protein ligase TRIM56-like [Acanthaster planci]|uniref:E3 ubiquitin-protein ligase TRIM56-like n=1 Tax=Acanthaster planci TaxID=133434 RepID=A0A8B7Z7L6_ACAPL|nr:E3 ubiquitin-protein ligase TRIM56-like [Acanthaster planci]